MNELLFFAHTALVVFVTLGALRFGKEALVGLTVLLAVLANFFVLKQTLLFGWNVTCSDVFAVGSILSLNLLQEHFGKEAARHTIKLCFFALLFFGAMSQLHLLYTPSPFDTAHPHFLHLLSPTPRLLIASLLSFALVQKIDLSLFQFLKNRFPRIDFQWRSTLSLLASQLLDTLFFTLLGLYGLVDSLLSIMVISFIIKCIVILNIASLSKLVRHEV